MTSTAIAQRDPHAARRLAGCVAALVIAWPMLALSEFKPWALFAGGNLAVIGGFLAGFFPPDGSAAFLALLFKATLETLAMATAGTALALLIGAPLGFVTTRALSISRIGPGPGRVQAGIVRQAARWLLMVLRAIPEIVWALLFVRALGLGPAAGVLALAITYGGMLGKVYGEILDSGETGAAQALLRNGSGRLQAFFFALLPQNASELTSYTVYRWECAIRSSAVLGFVGAGGLGQRMDESMKMLAGGEVASMLLIFVLLVACADGVSKLLRGRLA